ncbi:MAG: dual specificity protein phosphatase family protein [Thermoflexibacter sp.]|jgi:protein-tyrosine phosphatase|nr:dual specificity protein phosphatase family protein [Thermoflexibacter sp.]
MHTKLYFIDKQLAICPKPRGGEDLAEEVLYWKKEGISLVISLLTKAESKELSLEGEQKECEKQGIDFVHFPIQDRQVPESYLEYNKLIDRILERVSKEQKVLIHCRGGIGRASLVAGGVLIKQGFSARTAIETISKSRTLKVPDTEEQERWLGEVEQRIIK